MEDKYYMRKYITDKQKEDYTFSIRLKKVKSVKDMSGFNLVKSVIFNTNGIQISLLDYLMDNLNGTENYLCYIGNNVIGLFSLDFKEDSIYIYNFGIYSEYRKQGLGSELIEIIINIAYMSGYNKIELKVKSINLAAISLYSKYGFE